MPCESAGAHRCFSCIAHNLRFKSYSIDSGSGHFWNLVGPYLNSTYDVHAMLMCLTILQRYEVLQLSKHDG